MSTVQEDLQKAREALSKLDQRLKDSHKTNETMCELRKSLERAMHVSASTGARLPVLQDERLGREDEAATRSALEHVEGVVSLVNSAELLVRVSRITHAFTVPHRELALFVGLLRYCGVLPKKQEYSLDEQEILQKCAFIARAFGLDMGYEWHLNEYGTFSPFLAADHVELVDCGAQVDFGAFVGLNEVPGYRELMEGIEDGAPVPETRFEAGRFILLVSGKSVEWLSLASTMVHERGSCPDGELLERVSRINADYDKGLARKVMEDLESSRPPAWDAPAREAGRGA